MLSTLASGEWIQNRRRNRSFAVIWGLLAAGITGFCVYLLVGAIRNDQILGVFVILAAFSPLAVHAGWYAFGSARAGLMITHDAVIIRNPLRKREVPVQDVARFTAGRQPARRGNPTPGILVEVKGGRAYSVWTLAREGLVWNTAANVTEWEGVAQSLNDLLRSVG